MKMARLAHDHGYIEELELLAWHYLERAKEMETNAAGQPERGPGASPSDPR